MPSYTIAEHPPPSWRKQNKAKGGTHKLMNFPGLFMLQNQSESMMAIMLILFSWFMTDEVLVPKVVTVVPHGGEEFADPVPDFSPPPRS